MMSLVMFARKASAFKLYNLVKSYNSLDISRFASFASKGAITNRNEQIERCICWNQPRRFESQAVKKDGYITKFMKKALAPHLNKSKLQFVAYLHYENVVDFINYAEWFKACKRDDTFMSWYLVTELHVWMLMVRTMAEGEDGRFVRNAIVECLWNDVSQRITKIGVASTKKKKIDMTLISQQFQATLIGYDEGVCTNDMVLAAAVWRRFFEMSCDDAVLIENVVKYIRKQTLHLEKIPRNKFLVDPRKQSIWLPLKLN